MTELYIVVENNSLKPYKSISELVDTIDNLAEFIVKDPKLVCLKFNPNANAGKKEAQWEISDVALTDIAKAIINKANT